MVKAKGLNLQNQTVKTAVFHAALADVTLGIAVWQLVVKHVEEEHVPQGKSALISVALLLAIGNTAALGGDLVYTHGYGVRRMGTGKVEKQKEIALEREQGRQAGINL